LYGEFTTEEALRYYGRIHGKNKKEIEEKIEFLVRLLDLPDQTRQISTLRYEFVFRN